MILTVNLSEATQISNGVFAGVRKGGGAQRAYICTPPDQRGPRACVRVQWFRPKSSSELEPRKTAKNSTKDGRAGDRSERAG